jgi:carbonic anhydrase/acetyltransferase-like protein (isoleucine patch superfamily)
MLGPYNLGLLISKSIKTAKLAIGRFITEIGGDLERKGSEYSNDIAYLQVFSRHRKFSSINDVFPQVSNAHIAENSSILGDVQINSYANIGHNVTMRAEVAPIRIGSYASIGDGCSFNTWYSVPGGVPQSINVGNNSIIEPGCVISSCIIDENVFVGSRSVIGEGVKIGKEAVIAPNSFISPGSYIPPGQLWSGSPVKFVRELTEEEKYSTYIKSYDNWSVLEEKKSDDNKAYANEMMKEYTSENYFKWRAKYSF